MKMPWPPGVETLTYMEFAGAVAEVDVMGLTSMRGSSRRSFLLHLPLKTDRLAGSGRDRPPIEQEGRLGRLNARKLHESPQ